MRYKVSLTPDQIEFLTRVMKDYVDDEETYRTTKEFKETGDFEVSNLRLYFYKTLHNKFSRKTKK